MTLLSQKFCPFLLTKSPIGLYLFVSCYETTAFRALCRSGGFGPRPFARRASCPHPGIYRRSGHRIPCHARCRPPILPTPARIIGNIPDGTPPPPQPPKPQFVARATDILESKVHQRGGRTITIHKIKPIALPPPPDPAPQSLAAADPAFQERLAAFKEAHPKSDMVMLGATVYRFKDSPPRTLVNYWPEGSGKSITFWSSADFALISGIYSSVATDGETRSMFMMWSSTEVDRIAERLSAHGRKYDGPNIPAFPDGLATFTIVGTPPADPTVLVPIQSLHDLYNSEFNRLKTAWDCRERARIEHEAYLKAHPPQPKNITLNYWRTEKSAAEKGAAR